MAIINKPNVGEVLWARVRGSWRKVRVDKVKSKNFDATTVRACSGRVLFVRNLPWNYEGASYFVSREVPPAWEPIGREWQKLAARARKPDRHVHFRSGLPAEGEPVGTATCGAALDPTVEHGNWTHYRADVTCPVCRLAAEAAAAAGEG